jgi:hypothetical protein
MTARALLLFGVMLASPAWSQETPPLTARSFDLTSDSVRQIVHDTAAAQSTAARAAEEPPKELKPAGVVRYVPPVKPEPAEPPQPRLPSAPLSPFLSAVADILVDEVLHIDEVSSYDAWLANRSRDSLESFRQRAQTPDEYPPSPVRPKP